MFHPAIKKIRNEEKQKAYNLKKKGRGLFES
jgi:hypothetical protein